MRKPSKIQALALGSMLSAAMAVPLAFGQSGATNAPSNGQQPAEQTQTAPKEMRSHRRMGLWRELDLTDAQKAQIREIRKQAQPQIATLRKEIRAKRQEVRQAYNGGTFNEALASQKLAAIAPLQAQLMAERFKVRHAMLSVLTPEQKAKLDQLRQQHKTARAEARAHRS